MRKRIRRYADIEQPRLPTSASMSAEINPAPAVAFSQARLEDADWSGQQMRLESWDQCLIHTSRFNELKAHAWEWNDVQMQSCELLNADLEKARWRRCEVFDSRLGGVRVAEAQLEQLLMRGCQVDFGVFWNTHIAHTRFDDCRMTDVSFTGSRLKHVTFRNCDLSRADFTGARLEQVDLRGCSIEGMIIDNGALRGAVVDPQQALALMGLLGITVKPLDAEEDD